MLDGSAELGDDPVAVAPVDRVDKLDRPSGVVARRALEEEGRRVKRHPERLRLLLVRHRRLDRLRPRGDHDAVALAEEKALFNARVDPRTKAEIGSRLRLAVDPHRFHFFDPKTGKSLLASEPAAAEPEVVLTTDR